MEEVDEALVLPLVQGMQAATGFEVDDARIDFYGRCARCASGDAAGS